MGNLIDLTNQIFGDYKVTGFDNSKGKGKYYWKVKCIYCGNVYCNTIRFESHMKMHVSFI